MGYINFMDVQGYCSTIADMLGISVERVKEIVYPTMALMSNGSIQEVDGLDYIEHSIGELIELANGIEPFVTTIVIPQKTLTNAAI